MSDSATKQNILFITGTDTGIGKTFVTTYLLFALKKRGIRVHAMKPVETGCGENLRALDAELLRQAAGDEQSLEQTILYRFKAPVAPNVAAREEGMPIDIKLIVSSIKSFSKAADLLVIEGAGGLLVPLESGYTWAELIEEIGASVLLVVGSRLGAINHSALTFEVLKAREISTLGYVFNDLFFEQDESSESVLSAQSTNRAELQQMASTYGLAELCAMSRHENTEGDDFSSAPQESIRLASAVIDYFGLKS